MKAGGTAAVAGIATRVALFLALPVWQVWGAGTAALGPVSLDLSGHVWTVWNAGQGSVTRSTMVAWPEGVDLMPILGGWLDIFIGSVLVQFMSPIVAFNVVCGLFLMVGGWGGYALARAAGSSAVAATLAGFVLQLDGYLWHHMFGGRSEQLGVGFVALALAAAWSLRKPGWKVALTGVAGALVVYVSWEHAMFLAAALLVLLPAVTWDRERAKAWAMAAGVCVLLAGPWSAMFVLRTLEVRELAEGAQMMGVAPNHSIVLGKWLSSGMVRPSLLCMACLVFLRGRAWAVAGVGLVVSLLLAVGPTPGWMAPGDLGIPGPWAAMQSLPFLGWFHTPDRLAVGINLAAVCGAAAAFDRLKGPWRWVLAFLLVVSGILHVYRTVHPRGHWSLPPPIELVGEGAVLDLPAFPPGMEVGPYQFHQLMHQRPIPYHMTATYLTHDSLAGLIDGLPAIQALVAPAVGTVPEDTLVAELRVLRERGVGTLMLHTGRFVAQHGVTRQRLLSKKLGSPERWMNRPVWDLAELPEE